MGNLCSIFHSRFKNLIRVVPSARKAQLVDYILLGWQTSTYKLKGSNKKWFMKPYTQITDDTGIPRSTLERYIKELDNEGLIERRQALYSRTNEHGEFEVKKGAYINLTEKFLALISNTALESDKSIHTINNANIEESRENSTTLNTECHKSVTNEGIENSNMRELYIRNLYTYPLNNIISSKLTHAVDNPTSRRLAQQFETIKTLLFKKIKEEIPDEVKNFVLGTFYNLTFKHHKQFSSPAQLASEYLFTLLNTDFYMPDVKCFKHRTNILAKMIRQNQWKTPKGFYKHFYLGQSFKDKQILKEQTQQQMKEFELYANSPTIVPIEHEKLARVEAEMYKKSLMIDEITKQIYEQTTEEGILILRDKIQQLKHEQESLWSQQADLENKITSVCQEDISRCA